MVNRLLTLSALFSANAQFALQIGPALNYTIAWSAHNDEVDICVSAISNSFNSESYIAIGFAPSDSKQMMNADIVVGSVSTAPFTVFSDAPQGRPQGVSSLQISRASVSLQSPRLTMCFTRPIYAATSQLTNNQRVIWAVGTIGPNGELGYHGSDSEDPTGQTQTHRSEATPRINFLYSTTGSSEEDGTLSAEDYEPFILSEEGEAAGMSSSEEALWVDVPLPASQTQLAPQVITTTSPAIIESTVVSQPPQQEVQLAPRTPRQPRQSPQLSFDISSEPTLQPTLQPTLKPSSQPTPRQSQQPQQAQTQQVPRVPQIPQQIVTAQQPSSASLPPSAQPSAIVAQAVSIPAVPAAPAVLATAPAAVLSAAPAVLSAAPAVLSAAPAVLSAAPAVLAVSPPVAVLAVPQVAIPLPKQASFPSQPISQVAVQDRSAATTNIVSAPTPKTSTADRQSGSTVPPTKRQWLSNTFAETGSPMFQQPAVATVATATLYASTTAPLLPVASSLLPVAAPLLPVATPLIPVAAPAIVTYPTTATLPLTSTLSATTASFSASSLPASNSLSWPTAFSAGSQSSSTTQWSQVSNSWVPSTSALSSASSSLYPRPANQGFDSAEIHTFSDNLQPGFQATNRAQLTGGYWNPSVNPGWANMQSRGV